MRSMPLAAGPLPAASSIISRTASSAPSRRAVKVPSSGRSSGMVVLLSHAPFTCWYRSSCGRTLWSIFDRAIPECGTEAPSMTGCRRRWHRCSVCMVDVARCCSFILRTRVTVKWCAQNCFFLAAAARPQTRSSARPTLVAEFVLPGHLSLRNHRKGPDSNAKRTEALRNARPPLHPVPGPDHC